MKNGCTNILLNVSLVVTDPLLLFICLGLVHGFNFMVVYFQIMSSVYKEKRPALNSKRFSAFSPNVRLSNGF